MFGEYTLTFPPLPHVQTSAAEDFEAMSRGVWGSGPPCWLDSFGCHFFRGAAVPKKPDKTGDHRRCQSPGQWRRVQIAIGSPKLIKTEQKGPLSLMIKH